jgi:DNA polymerase
MFKFTLHRDYETKSVVDLRKTGTHVYAEHESTDAWMCAYAVNDEPPKLWIPGAPVPPEFKEAAENPEWEAVAHNNAFESTIESVTLARRYNWPQIPIERQRCTMAQALAMALPPGLGDCANALGLKEGKDIEGRDLMLRMSKPRRPRKGEDTNAIYWWDEPERIERLGVYCIRDVKVEREIDKNLLPLRPSEQALWVLDAKINSRGVHVDTELCRQALQIVDTATDWLNEELRELTDGQVAKTTSVRDLTAWLESRGVSTGSLDKASVADLLARPGLPAPVRRALEIRAEGAKAAVKKIGALLSGTSRDSRARGLLQFHAASTGRWAGRRFQPQNIARPKHKKSVPAYIDAVATGSAEFVRMVHGDPLATVSDCLRGMVGAAPDNVLYAADFSNIEGRLIAWFADEQWKLQAFRDFDAGIGHDIYHITAGKILGKDPGPIDAPTITDEERQGSGKVPELALGYQGGVGAFQNMAKIYGVVVSDERADEIKVQWREEHPNTVQWWYDLEQAAKDAIANPGTTYHAGRIAFRKAGSFLYMRLPSGRAICYPFPCMKRKLMPWTTKGALIAPECDEYCTDCNGSTGYECAECEGLGIVTTPAIYEQLPVWKDSICYKGVDQFTRQWSDQFAHGGLLANNAVQGTARDVEAEAIVRVEAAGYPVVLSVHDEVVSETPDDFGSLDEFKQLMATLPGWAEGLPLAVSGFKARRYQK